MAATSPTNTLDATPIPMSHEIEDKIMSVLPKELTDWVRFEATSDLDLSEIFRAWRRGSSPAQIISVLRGAQRKVTREVYGASHPQASLI